MDHCRLAAVCALLKARCVCMGYVFGHKWTQLDWESTKGSSRSCQVPQL